MKLTHLPALPGKMKWFAGTVKVGEHMYGFSVPAVSWSDAEAALNDFCGPGVIVGQIAGIIRGTPDGEDA